MKRNKTALVILEHPWGLDTEDQNVVSVLPYFQGLEKLEASFDLYHSAFYEAHSFEAALNELTKMDYKNYYVYVACHGRGLRLGRMNLGNMLHKLNAKAQHINLVGVLLGACLVGRNTHYFEAYTESSAIVWKMGYKCSVNWLEGTLLDLKLLQTLMALKDKQLQDKQPIITAVNQATQVFNADSEIGEDRDESPMLLRDSLSLVVQPRGQGHKAKDYSSRLFSED